MRYSSASLIDKKNVAKLQVAWTFHTHALDGPASPLNRRASFEATPISWGGLLYLDTPFNTVFALDPSTGAVRWSFDPHIDRTQNIYNVTSRGVALWHSGKPTLLPCGSDALMLATIDSRLIALDATTGKPCPRFGRDGQIDLTEGMGVTNRLYYEVTSPPTIVGDTVITGSLIADNQAGFIASGAVRGFDAVSAKLKWIWEPLQGMLKARQAAGKARIGSGNTWSVMSADPEHDLVFLPTGSAAVDFYGGERPGDNRDADSIVALRASTGEKVWSYQLVHHDLWDYDSAAQPVLFQFHGTIPALAITTKTSMVFVFNRLTGQPLYPIYERGVAQSHLKGEQSSPTQPFSSLPSLTPLHFTSGDMHLSQPADQAFCEKELAKLDNYGVFTPPSLRGVVVFPGDLGGANWGSASFDPTTGILYTRVSNLPFAVREVDGMRTDTFFGRLQHAIRRRLPESAGGYSTPPEFRTPDSGGEEREGSPQNGTPYQLLRHAMIAPSGAPCAPQPFGSIVAMDLQHGSKVWTIAHGAMPGGNAGSYGLGGVAVTAGGLLIAASTHDGLLRIYDKASGRQLWQATLPAPAEATPMTYIDHGRQFIVIAAGGQAFLGKGLNDSVVAFALPPGKTKK